MLARSHERGVGEIVRGHSAVPCNGTTFYSLETHVLHCRTRWVGLRNHPNTRPVRAPHVHSVHYFLNAYPEQESFDGLRSSVISIIAAGFCAQVQPTF